LSFDKKFGIGHLGDWPLCHFFVPPMPEFLASIIQIQVSRVAPAY
jgi:hypothetical protein